MIIRDADCGGARFQQAYRSVLESAGKDKINYFKANTDVDRRSCFARLCSSIKVVILVCVSVPFGLFLYGIVSKLYEGQSSD